jgi:hypothetical protein
MQKAIKERSKDRIRDKCPELVMVCQLENIISTGKEIEKNIIKLRAIEPLLNNSKNKKMQILC